MKPDIPTEVQTLLESYIKLLCREFGNAIYGVYIYGSLVTGCFNKTSSDIDFMTVIRRNMDEDDLKRIQSIHKKLSSTNRYGNMLEGEYVNYGDIKGEMPCKQYPYFAFGKFRGFVNLKNFAWFQLRERGITYYGADFKSIAGSTNWNKIRNELLDRINTYWPNMTNWKLILDRWLALVVLSVCRIYFSLENMSTTSKVEGGEYALLKLSEKWHPLISEALRIQKNSSKKSLYKSKIKRLKEAKEFIKDMSERYIVQFP